MRDGSDAIADWPLLNALVNTAAGASWVSIQFANILAASGWGAWVKMARMPYCGVIARISLK